MPRVLKSADVIDRFDRLERLVADGDGRGVDDVLALRAAWTACEAEREELARAAREARDRQADVASLYVAVHRLHETLDRTAVLQALEEIAASLVGCEELAVFELIGEPPVLAPVATVGIPAGDLGIVQVGDGEVGACARDGELLVAPARSAHARNVRALSACIPLRVDGRTTGVLALYRLLDHKDHLTAGDMQILELLGTHAATALLATRLATASRPRPS
jgi:GAF domain-containing protein